MRGRYALLALVGVAVGGCVSIDRGHFAALSTVPLPGTLAVIAEHVEGRACGAVFRDPLRRALDDALSRSPGANALVDVRYRFEDLCVVVGGRAVKTP